MNILSIFKGWVKFVKATKLCLEWDILIYQVDEIEKLFRQFVIQYERYSVKDFVEFGSSIYYNQLLMFVFRDYVQRDSE